MSEIETRKQRLLATVSRGLLYGAPLMLAVVAAGCAPTTAGSGPEATAGIAQGEAEAEAHGEAEAEAEAEAEGEAEAEAEAEATR